MSEMAYFYQLLLIILLTFETFPIITINAVFNVCNWEYRFINQ